MKRVGVDHKIAAASGYDVRVDSKGVEYAVKKGDVTTFNTVPGVCGTSWVYFTAIDKGKHYTSIYTGFEIVPGFPGALYVSWDVGVIDKYGSSTKSWRDPASSVHFWVKTRGFTSSGPGKAHADVLPGSIATLSDGTICYSHGPSDSADL